MSCSEEHVERCVDCGSPLCRSCSLACIECSRAVCAHDVQRVTINGCMEGFCRKCHAVEALRAAAQAERRARIARKSA
jgi:hypothetical protein